MGERKRVNERVKQTREERPPMGYPCNNYRSNQQRVSGIYVGNTQGNEKTLDWQ